MKTLLLFLLCWLTVQTVRAEDAIPALTVDGVTYSNVTFGTVTPTKVTIFYSRGIASIPLEKLSPELQKRFGYDPQKAKQWQDAQVKAAADAVATKQRQASAEQWILTVDRVIPAGLVAHGYMAKGVQYVGGRAGLHIVGQRAQRSEPPIEIRPPSVSILLVSHPQQKELAQGNELHLYANKEGVTNVLGRTLERWVYARELVKGVDY